MIATNSSRTFPIVIVLSVVLVSCTTAFQTNTAVEPATSDRASDGPGITTNPNPHESGNASAGKDVFRFETFGNEGFWTDAMRMPQGMMAAKITPKQMLESGLQIDIDAVPAELRSLIEAEAKTDLSAQQAPALNDPKNTVALVNANAVVGMAAKDSNGDKKIDLMTGDKVGVACTLCHTITDKSVYDMPNGGSIGRRVDGPAALTLNVGKLLAVAANSRAYYPNLQLAFDGKTTGRAPVGLGPKSTEAEVDAYLSNVEFYPIGTFDETQDGIGNPVKNTPLFRQDLAAPYGSAGEFAILDDIGNASYTTNLDPTMLVTPEGRKLLEAKAGPAGRQLADEYAAILKDTKVIGHPYVKAAMTGKMAPSSPVGRRVDNQKLLDMNAYLDALPAPRGADVDPEMARRGRELFRTQCTQCHNVDQGVFVPPTLVDLKTLWPGYAPVPAGTRGDPKLSPILNSPGGFDDKMIIVDASDRGAPRGNALPLLLDLARTTIFLHDASVRSLEDLLKPDRGDSAPHPFYIRDGSDRKNVIEFLRGTDTNRAPTTR